MFWGKNDNLGVSVRTGDGVEPRMPGICTFVPCLWKYMEE